MLLRYGPEVDNFSSLENCFVFLVFAFKINVSIILKIIQGTYQLTKKKLTGVSAKNCDTIIQQVLILKFAFGPEKFPGLLRSGPLALITMHLLQLACL